MRACVCAKSRFRSHMYEVQAGMLRRESWSPYEQCVNVSHIHKHPNYHSTHYYNDIALVRLLTPLQLNKFVRIVAWFCVCVYPDGICN